jgi:hypothetical protein
VAQVVMIPDHANNKRAEKKEERLAQRGREKR